jgi:stress-induced morphogen
MSPDEIRLLIRQAIPDARVKLQDLTGTGDHFEALVVSAAFEGKSLVEQHQMVYGALREAMKGPLHALQLRTLTPGKARDAGHSEESFS